MAKNVGGVATYYIHDEDNVIEERNSAGVLVADYAYGPNIDEALTMMRSGSTYKYFYDGLGSARQVTNPSGTVLERYDYDPTGKPTLVSAIGNRIMFTGRWYDPDSGNYYYRNRYMNPSQGRFLQRDMVGSMIGPSVNVNLFSLEFYTRNHTTEDILNFFMQKNSQRTNIFGYLDGMNLYTYVRNNSINYLDPFGLKSASSDPRVQKYLAELAQKSAYCFRFEPNNNKCWSDVEKKARECAKTAADVTKEPEPYDPTNDNCDRSGQLDNPGAI